MSGFSEKVESRAERGYWMTADGIVAVIDMETEHIINCLNIIDASAMPKAVAMFESELSRRARAPEDDLLDRIRELEKENARLREELSGRSGAAATARKVTLVEVGYEVAPATRAADYLASCDMPGTDRLSTSDGMDWSEIVTEGWHPVWGHS